MKIPLGRGRSRRRSRRWDFLLDDLKRNLTPGGRIFLDLNASYDGRYYTPEILIVFVKHGGRVERGQVLFQLPG